MKTYLFPLLTSIILFYSCNKEENPSQYPKSFHFHHSNITDEKGFVIGDNETYGEINSKSGNLDSLRNQVAYDLFAYIRTLGFGTYIETIEFLNKDSIQIHAWVNGTLQFFTLPADIENVNGEVIDKSFYGSSIHWNSNTQEINYCFALSLGILNRNGNFSSEINYDFCQSADINGELQINLMNSIYEKNDTLGIYLLNMIYK